MIQGRIKLNTKWILVPTAIIALSAWLFFRDNAVSADGTTQEKRTALGTTSEARKALADALGPQLWNNHLPKQLTVADKGLVDVKYTLDRTMQEQSEKLLLRYKPDYGAIVMLDATTGKILAMSSYVKGQPTAANLTLRASFPAASIFKIITASTAVDRKGADPKDMISYNGGNYTLYKKNVLSEKVNRWTRFISLKDAFARSINTAFGRLTLETLDPQDLSEYSRRFMFNKYIPADFALEQSVAQIPEEKGFELTQAASGYNRFNTMSPVHGAMIAGAIINDGKILAPYLVEEVSKDQEIIYKGAEYDIGQAITKESAVKVREMMEQTVLKGTSRKTFRKLIADKKFRDVEMGGKTGHFSGLNPKGNNDWFVGYASDGDTKVAIAAITVNVQKWTVKSSALAEMMFREHFRPGPTLKAKPEDFKSSGRLVRGSGRILAAHAKSGKTSRF
ncbi:penicillin-binding protein [Bdellovibrio sp. qaytius]|nr:penicillin-binding protein [Bdellovibrio sp. qaytius]